METLNSVRKVRHTYIPASVWPLVTDCYNLGTTGQTSHPRKKSTVISVLSNQQLQFAVKKKPRTLILTRPTNQFLYYSSQVKIR